MRIRVTVPATSANLGSGFDVLGLALELYNEIEAVVIPEGLAVTVEGEGADSLPRDATNLVVQAMSIVFERAGLHPTGLGVHCHNRIPLGRGLGSSAAAIVGGLLAANHLIGEPYSREELMVMAVEREGHPDNVVPAFLGGLVVSVPHAGRVEYVRINPSFGLNILVVVPDFQVPTAFARQVLPSVVPLKDAVFNLGRVALFLAGIFSGEYDHLAMAMDDRLHQNYRADLVPGMVEAIAAARGAGAAGVALSGAGPSMLAFVPERAETEVADAMLAAFSVAGVKAEAQVVVADLFGAEVSSVDRPQRSLVVQRYGDSAMADADGIRRVADRVAETRGTGDDVVVVLSAMGSTTDELIAMANSINPAPPPREMDMLLATGEQISIALLSMALNRKGVEAVSLTGSQVGIITDRAHRRARIRRVDREKVASHLRDGRVVVVAGLQGREVGGDVTTLGRGGSDTTAVAVAAALRADRCEVYTDVEGVFTADPRLIPDARLIRRISYDEMLEMADLGARVLQPRSVEVAKRFGVTLVVRSSFSDDPGTQVGGGDDMEEVIIRAVTHSCDEIKLVLEAVPDVPGVAARVFRALANAGVKVDMILQGMHHEGRNDIAFTVVREHLDDARRVCGELAVELGARRVGEDAGIAKVSVVGAGISQDAGVAASMFEALAEEGINIDMIGTSPLRISCVISRDRAADAVGALHRRFNLAG